jgi:transcriptional regulator with XRE-family HTH domain
MSVSEEEFKIRLGKKIEDLRTSTDFGVRELALKADIEHHQLINIQKGRVDARICTLKKIADALGIELKVLLDF